MIRKKLTSIVIDDEAPARAILKSILELHGGVEVVAETNNANTGILLTIEYQPDVVFLDVEMPGKSGIEMIDELKKLNLNPIIILTTAFPDFAIEAIDRAVFGYLVKPIDLDKLNRNVNRALCEKYKKNISNKLRFTVSKGFLWVETTELICAIAHGNYTELFLFDGTKHTITQQLGKLISMLPQHNFMRVSRSAIINKQYLKFIDKQKLICTLQVTSQKIEVPISRETLKILKEVN
jgi:DNA-binding LytR/AlgR family response regulator